jgi:hypothetical protein
MMTKDTIIFFISSGINGSDATAISEVAERRMVFIILYFLRSISFNLVLPSSLAENIPSYNYHLPDEVIVKGNTNNDIDRKGDP